MLGNSYGGAAGTMFIREEFQRGDFPTRKKPGKVGMTITQKRKKKWSIEAGAFHLCKRGSIKGVLVEENHTNEGKELRELQTTKTIFDIEPSGRFMKMLRGRGNLQQKDVTTEI